VKANTGEVRMGKAKGGRGKERSRKKMG